MMREGADSLETTCRRSSLQYRVFPDALRVWSPAPDAIAHWLATSLELAGNVGWNRASSIRLGQRRIGRKLTEIIYIPNQHIPHAQWVADRALIPRDALVLRNSTEPVVDVHLPGRRIVSLESLIGECEAKFTLDPRMVREALGFVLNNQPDMEPLPAQVSDWSKVTMRVMNKETIEVIVGHRLQVLTPESAKLLGVRGGKPTVRAEWHLLLAFAAARGEFDRPEAKSAGRIRQSVSRLRDVLRSLFGIEDDPIVANPGSGGWKCQFKISRWDENHLPPGGAAGNRRKRSR